MGSKLIVRAAACGHHFHDDCTSCVSAKDWTNNEMDEMRARITALEAMCEKMAGALEWYAEPVLTYAITQASEPRSAVHADGGKRARETLAQYREADNGR